jgi:hypothetical protein
MLKKAYFGKILAKHTLFYEILTLKLVILPKILRKFFTLFRAQISYKNIHHWPPVGNKSSIFILSINILLVPSLFKRPPE